jgi:chloramphenicol 3-O phosphotransferase
LFDILITMIILLNGTSSSGKSSIISSLEKKLTDLYFIFGVDKFLEPSMPYNLNMEIPEHLSAVDKSISGFNKSIGVHSKYISHMIIDHVLQNPNWIHEIAYALKDDEVFFVGVTAPLHVIEEREKSRSNRKTGTAKNQYEQMLKYSYDLIVDTSILTSDEAAEEIIKNLKAGNSLNKYAHLEGRSAQSPGQTPHGTVRADFPHTALQGGVISQSDVLLE